MRVVIIGNGIVANLAALYARKRVPEGMTLTVVGPESRGGMPIVGESTIEITARFLEQQLGLGEYLRDNHLPKYALTYYFKLRPDDPDDRRYSVHCNERAPVGIEPIPGGWEGPMARPPSWQLNRHTFDAHIQKLVTETAGIERVWGMVKDVEIAAGDRPHTVTIKGEDGQEQVLQADWVIDASGRRQVLAKRLGVIRKSKESQRDAFWFRIVDFDRSLLARIDALGPMPDEPGDEYHYDRYYSTHHFMGKGNWIWVIPQRPEKGSVQASVGLSSRPDCYPYKVRNIDDFLEHVAKEHPVLTEFVRSGKVVDTNTYSNYRYVIDKAYSEDRWAIIGDAAFAPDPLFSNGLAFGSMQIEQVGELLARDVAGEHSAEYVDGLEKVFWTPVISSQNTIAEWYETMDDPLLCAVRLQLIELTYFYWILPLIVNRCHLEPDRLVEWSFMQLGQGKPLELPPKLHELREQVGEPHPEHFIYRGKEKVNLDALTVCEDLRDLREQFSIGANLVSAYVDELAARWKTSCLAGAARRR